MFSLSKDPTAEFALPEYFYPTYCDYFCRIDNEDVDASIEWLTDTLQRHNVQFDIEGNKITLYNVDGYFDDIYAEFQQVLSAMQKITRDDFQKLHCCTAEYDMKSVLSDECGFWFMLYDECPDTMQHFMRYVELNVPYYITAIYDYHF